MARTKVIDDVGEESVEVFASSLRALSEGVSKLLHAGLNERALVLLLEDASNRKVGKKQIIAVLRALENLKHEYLQPEGE